MTNIEQQEQIALSSLQESVREALEIKRRLGQYAVVWKDGKVVRLFEEEEISGKAMVHGEKRQ